MRYLPNVPSSYKEPFISDLNCFHPVFKWSETLTTGEKLRVTIYSYPNVDWGAIKEFMVQKQRFESRKKLDF